MYFTKNVEIFGTKNRISLTNSLREFIKVDNKRALFGAREHFNYESRKRKNSDELTLRAEEVGTSKALVNVHHIENILFVTGNK